MNLSARMFLTISEAVSYIMTYYSMTTEEAQEYVDRRILLQRDNFVWIMIE